MSKRPKQKKAKEQFRLTCMFCEKPGSSREHYFSTWMHKYFEHLPARVRPALYTARIAPLAEDSGITSAERDTGRSRVHDPVLQVCEDCNNHWMSDIVNRSKSAIERWCLPSGQDRREAITIEDQEAMATWAVLTAITYITAKRKETRVTLFDRTYLKGNSKAPPYWNVAMARIVSPDCHATLVDNVTAGFNSEHKIGWVVGGPWFAIALIDSMFFVWREARGAVPFIRTLTIPAPVVIHPARSTALFWDQLPCYEQNVADMAVEQLTLAAAANLPVLTPARAKSPAA